MKILSLSFIIIIAFLPILLWGYVFSYLDNTILNARHFLLGILAGCSSIIPVLFLENLFRFFGAESFNIFPFLVSEDIFGLLVSFSLTILIIGGFTLLSSTGLFFENAIKSLRPFLKNTGIILVFGIIYVLFHSLVSTWNILDTPLGNKSVTLSGTTFDTVKLILLYYLVIAFIEEASKHLSVVTSSVSSIDSVKRGVLFSIFIALGFGFIENILYLSHLVLDSGFFSVGTVSTWIFRSIVSIFVHVICSAIVGYYFSKALLLPEIPHRWIAYVRLFSKGFLISVVVHAVFDISLTLGFTGIIFVYLFFGYLFITRVFYGE